MPRASTTRTRAERARTPAPARRGAPRAASTTAPRAPRAAAKGASPTRARLSGEAVRGQVEDLALQADLAAMDVRDEIRSELETAENAWLAARRRLEDAVEEADRALAGVRHALGAVIADLAGAVLAADATVRRSRGKG